MKVIWSAKAQKQLSAIQRFIAKDSIQHAKKFRNYLINRCSLLANHPKIGHKLIDYPDSDIRELIVKNYRIFYRIHQDRIDILYIYEGQQLIDYDDIVLN